MMVLLGKLWPCYRKLSCKTRDIFLIAPSTLKIARTAHSLSPQPTDFLARERQRECADTHPRQVNMSATRFPLATNASMSKNNPASPVSFAKWTGNGDTSFPYPRYSPPSELASAPSSHKRKSSTIRKEVRICWKRACLY